MFFPSRTEQEKMRVFLAAALGSITRSIFRGVAVAAPTGADDGWFQVDHGLRRNTVKSTGWIAGNSEGRPH